MELKNSPLCKPHNKIYLEYHHHHQWILKPLGEKLMEYLTNKRASCHHLKHCSILGLLKPRGSYPSGISLGKQLN
jgi:hypothetical protein